MSFGVGDSAITKSLPRSAKAAWARVVTTRR